MPLARSLANSDVEAGSAAPASKSPPRKKVRTHAIRRLQEQHFLPYPSKLPMFFVNLVLRIGGHCRYVG